MYSLLMEILYASSFAFLGLIINRIGKITILCKDFKLKYETNESTAHSTLLRSMLIHRLFL